MSYVFTYTTKIKNKNYNQSLCKYISDWTIIFNKIQRKVWQQIKAEYKETGEVKGEIATVDEDSISFNGNGNSFLEVGELVFNDDSNKYNEFVMLVKKLK